MIIGDFWNECQKEIKLTVNNISLVTHELAKLLTSHPGYNIIFNCGKDHRDNLSYYLIKEPYFASLALVLRELRFVLLQGPEFSPYAFLSLHSKYEKYEYYFLDPLPFFLFRPFFIKRRVRLVLRELCFVLFKGPVSQFQRQGK